MKSSPLFFLFLFLTGVSLAHATDLPAQWPLPQAPAGVGRASFPVPRMDWYGQFQGSLDKLKLGPYDLLIDGDSITNGWGKAPDVWKQHFGHIKTINFAIGGDQVQHVLWRVQNGELENLNPKLIMLMIGTNNLGQDPKEVADGIKVLIGEYEKRCPNAHILLLSVFPRAASPEDPARAWVAKVNAIISTYVDDKRVTYLDFGAKFLQPDGKLTADIMPDFLHPTPKGYEIWAQAVQPVMDQYFPPAAK